MQTIAQLTQTYNANQQVVIAGLGNSIGCGYRSTNYQNINSNGWRTNGSGYDWAGICPDVTQNDPTIGGFFQQLQVWLKQRNVASIVYNYSGSGWTTQGHLDRHTIDCPIQGLVFKSPKPTHCIIPLQTNSRFKDSANFPAGGETWAGYLANTKAICQLLISHNITPILMKEANQPLPAGNGWWWGEREAVGTNPPWPTGTHRAWSEYMAAVDTIAVDADLIAALGHQVDVIDGYTPTLNTGQVAPYVYNAGQPAGSFSGAITGSNAPFGDSRDAAPTDWRSDLSKLWIPVGEPAGLLFDPIHLADAGHQILLNAIKNTITAASVVPASVPAFSLSAILTAPTVEATIGSNTATAIVQSFTLIAQLIVPSVAAVDAGIPTATITMTLADATSQVALAAVQSFSLSASLMATTVATIATKSTIAQISQLDLNAVLIEPVTYQIRTAAINIQEFNLEYTLNKEIDIVGIITSLVNIPSFTIVTQPIFPQIKNITCAVSTINDFNLTTVINNIFIFATKRAYAEIPEFIFTSSFNNIILEGLDTSNNIRAPNGTLLEIRNIYGQPLIIKRHINNTWQ